eukprot:gene14702-biopygen4052
MPGWLAQARMELQHGFSFGASASRQLANPHSFASLQLRIASASHLQLRLQLRESTASGQPYSPDEATLATAGMGISAPGGQGHPGTPEEVANTSGMAAGRRRAPGARH